MLIWQPTANNQENIPRGFAWAPTKTSKGALTPKKEARQTVAQTLRQEIADAPKPVKRARVAAEPQCNAAAGTAVMYDFKAFADERARRHALGTWRCVRVGVRFVLVERDRMLLRRNCHDGPPERETRLLYVSSVRPLRPASPSRPKQKREAGRFFVQATPCGL